MRSVKRVSSATAPLAAGEGAEDELATEPTNFPVQISILAVSLYGREIETMPAHLNSTRHRSIWDTLGP